MLVLSPFVINGLHKLNGLAIVDWVNDLYYWVSKKIYQHVVCAIKCHWHFSSLFVIQSGTEKTIHSDHTITCFQMFNHSWLRVRSCLLWYWQRYVNSFCDQDVSSLLYMGHCIVCGHQFCLGIDLYVEPPSPCVIRSWCDSLYPGLPQTSY